MAACHIGDETLLDHAAGNLNEAIDLLVASHLALCPSCRRAGEGLEAIGGLLLDALPEEPVEAGMLDRLFAAFESRPTSEDTAAAPAAAALLPQPLRRYAGGDLGELRWQYRLPGIAALALPLEDRSAAAMLLRVRAGRAAPAHTHRGSEWTLVLQGSFTDETGCYRRGDIVHADDSIIHRPVAGSGADCVCLVVTDGPLRLTGPLGRVLNPFLRRWPGGR